MGLEEEILPHTRSVEAVSTDGTAVSEEPRLFYVGITRARHRLTLSGCATRRQRGDSIPRQPSRFLKEVPADLLEHRTGKRTLLSEEESKELKASFFSNMRGSRRHRLCAWAIADYLG